MPLVLYSLLIFVRNIVAGFDGVPSEILEAANGIGYTRRDRFWQVEVPLAIPLIVAGIRLASVSTIGLVTITGILGDRFGGLGFFIFEGNRHGFPTELFTGRARFDPPRGLRRSAARRRPTTADSVDPG